MKKILLSLFLLGGLLTSCDMDLKPIGSIDESQAIENANDCYMFRNGIYNNLRALATGRYLYQTELQMDQFLGCVQNGNRNGTLSNGVILSSDSDIENVWGGCYGAIASTNFFIPKAEELLQSGTLDAEDAIAVERYLGETYFARATFYYYLLDHFCPVYNETNKDKQLGLCLVTEYAPTAEKTHYPDRSTLAETYTFIENDLAKAYEMIKDFEENSGDGNAVGDMLTINAPYVNSYTVEALQARLALIKGDYATALAKAQDVMGAGIWRLQNRLQLSQLWTNDNSTELIFRPISTNTELGISSTGGAYISTDPNQADYLPTSQVVNELYPDGDKRLEAYFGVRDLLVEGTFYNNAPIFIKYPGNPALIIGGPNLMNMAKPFRLAEMYLIAAEAACELGQDKDASTYLYNLRSYRIQGAQNVQYSGNELRNEVRTERARELIGEGFRMSDLRRWGLGFTRSGEYPLNPAINDIIVKAGTTVQYQPNDYRYVWPIPATEMQVNPHLAGQQNPGY